MNIQLNSEFTQFSRVFEIQADGIPYEVTVWEDDNGRWYDYQVTKEGEVLDQNNPIVKEIMDYLENNAL